MNFDINEVLSQMLDAIKGSVKENWKLVQEPANSFLQKKKERLELLASLRIENQIDQEFFLKRLESEKYILESELHAIAIISKAMAQKAANAAIQVLINSITNIIS